MTAGTVFASAASAAVVVDEAVVEEVAAAFDTTVAIMQGWDSTFEEPGLKYYDDDEDIAYYYFGKVHIDPGTLQECDEAGCATTTRDVHYTVAHELGHAWEAHLGTYADSAQEQEDFAECIAGAVGAEAGWDVYAMAEYTWGLQDDELHGTGDHRYDVLLDGADYGHEYCEAAYLP